MKYWLVVIILIFVQTVIGQQLDLNYSKINYGNQVRYLTARSLGLAGAGVASEDPYLSVSQNPALVVYSDSLVNLNAGIHVFKLEEDRSYPYYDNFGGFVDYGSYMFTKNWYEQFHGIITSKLPFESLMNLSISTGFIPFSDFNYDYLEEVRSDYYGDALLAYNIFKSKGMLNAIPLSAGLMPYQGELWGKNFALAIGAGVKLLTGKIDQNWIIETKDPSLTGLDYNIEIQRKLDNTPIVSSFGLRLKIGERFGLATSTQLGYAVQFTHDTVSAGSMGIQKLDFPLQQSIGLDYRFQNILEARIFFDFVYTFWEDFKDNWNPVLAYDNTINFRGGVEHIFFNKVPFRVGFDYRTLRESKNYSQTLVSIGSGFYLDKVRIDLAAGLSGLNYFQKDLYDNANYGLLTSTEADRVNWSELYARIDLNYSF